MMILNAQEPSPNYTPSSAAQVFVTQAQLQRLGLIATPSTTPKTAAPSTLSDRIAALEAQVAALQGAK
jgi:hypothetical protein